MKKIILLITILSFSSLIVKPVVSQYNGRILVLKGMVFIDNNKNTVLDDGEPGFGNVFMKPLDNAVDFQGNPLETQYNNGDGLFDYDGLMEKTVYRFNFSNPEGYLFESYDISLRCKPGKTCVRDAKPEEGYVGTVVIENLMGFEIPLIPANVQSGVSFLCLKISIDLGPLPTRTPSPRPHYNGIALIGNIFIDFNGNGKFDDIETWYSGASVTLYDNNKILARDTSGKTISSVRSDANGRFIFEDTIPGEYYIKFSGLNGVWDPRFIGPFSTFSYQQSSLSDSWYSQYYINLGNYGLTPKGNASCGGQAYFDFDFDDRFTVKDKAQAGMKINIYSPVYGFLLASVVTDSNGNWSVNNLVTDLKYRAEFVMDSYVSTGEYPTRFISGGEYGINIGLSNPTSNPNDDNSNRPTSFITTCFAKGNHETAFPQADTVVRFTSDATGRAYDSSGSRYLFKKAKNIDTGSVYGVTYRPESGDTYVSSFFKGGADFGPNGSGAIYKITSDNRVSLFVDLNQLFGPGYTGSNRASTTLDGNDAYYAQLNVLKTSLGDLQSNNRFLFVSNLKNNEIVQIPFTETPTSQNTFRMPVPDPGCGAEGDWHIFAVNLFQNELYVGGVCSGENGSTMRAYIQRFKNADRTWVVMIYFTLNYGRGCRTPELCANTRWGKWVPKNEPSQPQVGAIHFDDSGRMIIGLKDRGAELSLSQVSGPDMLVACPNQNGFYDLESSGVCGGHTGANPVMVSNYNPKLTFGPGKGQYFNVKGIYHDYAVAYGITKAGPNKIAVTGFDFTALYEAGIRWFDTNTGRDYNTYILYRNASYSFSKSNGLGSITPVYPPSLDVIECGRVWFDCNGNGIQDCYEKGIPNIKVFLYAQDNPCCPIAWALTDQNGYFKFVVLPGKNYACKIFVAEIKNKFGDFKLSPKLNDPSLEAIDSDAVLENGLLVANHTSSTISGLDIKNCHFGIIDPNSLPNQGGYGYWGPQKS